MTDFLSRDIDLSGNGTFEREHTFVREAAIKVSLTFGRSGAAERHGNDIRLGSRFEKINDFAETSGIFAIVNVNSVGSYFEINAYFTSCLLGIAIK